MTLAAVKAKLSAAVGGTLSLEATDFTGGTVAALFSTYLTNETLTMTGCALGADGLSVTGTMTIGGVSSAAASVAVVPDAANQDAAGVRIALPLPSWKVALSFATINAGELGSRGATAPRLLLSGGAPEAATDPVAAIAGDLTLPLPGASPAIVAAAIPPAADTPLPYRFGVDPGKLSVASLGALASVVEGFAFECPPIIPLGTLDLNHVDYAIAPDTGVLLSIDLTVGSAKGLGVIPGVIDIASFSFRFICSPPGSTPVIAMAMAAVTLHQTTEIDLHVVLPQLGFEGTLAPATPVPLNDFLKPFGIDDDFFDSLTLTEFDVALTLAPPYSYALAMTVEGLGSISLAGKSIDITTISVGLTNDGGGGGCVPDIDCCIAAGGTQFYLHAQKNAGGWLYTGGTNGGTLSFGDWIAQLAHDFSLGGLPASLTSLELDSILLVHDSGDPTKPYTFGCHGSLQISDVVVPATIEIDLAETAGQNVTMVKGALSIATASQLLSFLLDVNVAGDGTTTLTGAFAPATPVGLAELFDAIGFAQVLPQGIDIKLAGLGVAYRTRSDPAGGNASTFVITANASEYGEAMLVIDRTQSGSIYLFAADIPVTGSLSDIPFVGGAVPPSLGLSLNGLQLLLASRPIGKDEMATLATLASALTAALKAPAFVLPVDGLPGTANLTVGYKVGDEPQKTLVLGSQAAPPASARTALVLTDPPPPPAPPPQGKDETVWITLQRQLGVFDFHRIGFRYANAAFSVALDVGAALGPLGISFDNLSMGSPLTSFSPTFDISGIGLAYAQPPLIVSGALVKMDKDAIAPGVKFQFDGAVTVALEEIGIAGIASYAQMTSGDPSLFAFAELLAPLGGPPPFFVTGLMAGFGLNRSRAIPTMNDVQDFPLLLLAQSAAGGGATSDLTTVLSYLEGSAAPPGGTARAWIAPKPGAFWFAVGVQFTSFKVVSTDALLIVDPVDDLTIALLGLSSMTLPLPQDGGDPFCYVGLQLDASFKPDEGTFAATALLSNDSYVLTPDCHLTGGFAFYSWFGSSPHAGDFVLTLGGYHPAFAVPSHYPAVPRLAFNWAVSDNVTIKGDAYFALTPSVGMGGGGLQVLFQDGDIKAWFTANADFLMSWRPFWFLGDVDVDIGVSCHISLLFCHATVSLSIGAAVTIWGPPTGGKVHVHLVIVTFTVAFGSDNAGSSDDPLAWSAFKALLPTSASLCTVSAGNTVAATLPNGTVASTSNQRWVMRPRGFSFVSRSAIPASQLACDAPGTPHGAGAQGATIAIRPMYLGGVGSVHTVKISFNDPTGPGIALDDWTFTPATQSVPASLWGTPPAGGKQTPAAPSSDLVPNAFVGYDIASPDQAIVGGIGAIAYSLLTEHQVEAGGRAPLSTVVSVDPAYCPAPSTTVIANIAKVAADPAATARGNLLAALQSAGVGKGLVAGHLTNLAAAAAHQFTDAPMEIAA